MDAGFGNVINGLDFFVMAALMMRAKNGGC
jgi:hypothetical protein